MPKPSDIEALRELLYNYMLEFGPASSRLTVGRPDEHVLNRCLAIAPLTELETILTRIRAAKMGAGQPYTWFLTVFAHRTNLSSSSPKSADAETLRELLCNYMRDFGPIHNRQKQPGPFVLSRCLAIAPLAELEAMLAEIRGRKRRSGASYQWFVKTFEKQKSAARHAKAAGGTS
jgi:hypothetical protein